MSRDPIVKGWRGAAFARVDFAKYVTRWEDTRARAGKVHTYNKRDGGEGEDMGRAPHKATVHCAFIGQTWRADFLKLQAAIDDSPIDTLTHPLYGSMKAYARLTTGVMDVENAPNLYDVTLQFEESQIDTNAAADNTITSQGPAAKQQNITATIATATAAAALFSTAVSAIAAATAAASTYAAAAVASAATFTADPTLSQQLSSVFALTNAAITAIMADPIAAPGVVDPAIDACELLYDACAQMDDAVRALRPQLSLYTVPMTMHITALSQWFYGASDGPTREAEIITNNATTLRDPAMILAGTRLLMAPPTV